MTLADVYEHNAKQCRKAAERTDNAVHRVRLLKAASEWWQDAEALRASTQLLLGRDRNPKDATRAELSRGGDRGQASG
jgi:hypothetical protein